MTSFEQQFIDQYHRVIAAFAAMGCVTQSVSPPIGEFVIAPVPHERVIVIGRVLQVFASEGIVHVIGWPIWDVIHRGQPIYAVLLDHLHAFHPPVNHPPRLPELLPL